MRIFIALYASLIASIVVADPNELGSMNAVTWQPPTESKHFRYFVVGDVPGDLMKDISTALAGNRERIMSDLGRPELSVVTAVIWQNPQEFALAYGSGLSGARGYVNLQRDQIHLLNRGDGIATAVVHEFAHIVTGTVNSGIDARWLWEAVAVYEANERVDPSHLACLSTNQLPSLAELNSHHTLGNTKIYDLGYLLIDFILQRWGREEII